MNEAHSDYSRLEDQIAWFDEKSGYHQRWHRRLKILSIGAAALVPLASSLDGYAAVAGLLGVLVVISEGIQHINQHHDNWIRYRATCEDLRHEKYLYLARSVAYEGLTDEQAYRQLAANVEMLLAREGRAWVSSRRDSAKRQAGGAS